METVKKQGITYETNSLLCKRIIFLDKLCDLSPASLSHMELLLLQMILPNIITYRPQYIEEYSEAYEEDATPELEENLMKTAS